MNPLIAPKPFAEFAPDDWHNYVSQMYALRAKRGRSVKTSPVPGLSVNKTKSGSWSVRRAKKIRAFNYVTMPELAELAKASGASQADLWNAFKRRNFIMAKDRLEAERIYADIKDIPWS